MSVDGVPRGSGRFNKMAYRTQPRRNLSANEIKSLFAQRLQARQEAVYRCRRLQSITFVPGIGVLADVKPVPVRAR